MPRRPIIPVPFPEWAYINMAQLPFFGIALAVIIVVLVSIGFAYYGTRHVNKGISATKSMLPLTLFLMITPLFVGLIFLLGWPSAPHPTTHVYLGMIMLISAVTVDFATVRDMIRKTKTV
jgi:TRAP-type C4-dicarboxylate transport system permease small subunit